jgi:UDP-N-acetylglucosamine 2-epimerase (non-hydrolysing)
MKKILFIFGTRPEAIKMAPLIKQMQQQSSEFNVRICITGQHKEMLHQVLDFFEISYDYDLEIMQPDQTLFDITAKIVQKIEPVLKTEQPDLVCVQGDTTTAFIGALGAFYFQIPVVHLEAGLRTGNMYSPFPEELNRTLISKIAQYNFVPTSKAAQNLLSEGVDGAKVFNVGNTVVDALNLAVNLVEKHSYKYAQEFANVDFTKRIVLVTSHRRESAGQGFKNIMQAVKQIANSYDVEVVFPIHYSPQVRQAAQDAGLYKITNVHVIDPLDYPHLVYIMSKSHIILTDSGGIQEEAPSLAKPVLVMRDTTERPEGVAAGVAKLVGTDTATITGQVAELLDFPAEYSKMANTVNPYGDGKTSARVLEVLIAK